MTTITFVRHGNTDWNREHRAQGQLDVPLNEIGRAQARAVAERLSGERFDLIVSSDLSRARETAEIICSKAGRQLDRLDRRLREIYLGDIQGTIEEERVQKWGENWRRLHLDRESNQALQARGMECVEEIAASHEGQNILLVSHGGLIGQTLKGLFDDDSRGNDLQNTSVTVIKRGREGWEFVLYNCTQHLDSEIELGRVDNYGRF